MSARINLLQRRNVPKHRSGKIRFWERLWSVAPVILSLFAAVILLHLKHHS